MIDLICYSNLESEFGDCYYEIDFYYNGEGMELNDWGSIDSDEHALELIKEHLKID